MVAMKTRRLVITVTPSGEFRVETEYLGGSGYWSTISRTITKTFPLAIVGRVEHRDDYRILVRGR